MIGTFRNNVNYNVYEGFFSLKVQEVQCLDRFIGQDPENLRSISLFILDEVSMNIMY